jgi:hypothetical protein
MKEHLFEHSNPARVKAREEVHSQRYLFQKEQISLSIDLVAFASPNQYSLEPKGELNYRLFDQSYQFEVTTDPP